MELKRSGLIILSFIVVFVSGKILDDLPGLIQSIKKDTFQRVLDKHVAVATPVDVEVSNYHVHEGSGTHPYWDSIHFVLYTSRKPEAERPIHIGDDDSLLKLGFDINAPTKIICHGYMSDYKKGPADLLRSAYFKAYKFVNVIVINWAKLAGVLEARPESNKSKFENILHPLPANNTEIVGNATADMIVFLVKKVGVSRTKIHLIGHGMGAHAMGYAGLAVRTRLKETVSRITALDPAARCFPTSTGFGSSGKFRGIEKTDAKFVDAIHTHGNALCMQDPVGQADFYPNGSKSQPVCSYFSSGICSRVYSIELMAGSITLGRTKKAMRAQNCTSWKNYEDGRCEATSSALLGEFCSVRARGKYYLSI